MKNPEWRKFEQVILEIEKFLNEYPWLEFSHDQELVDVDDCKIQVDILVIDNKLSDKKYSIIECKNKNKPLTRDFIGSYIHRCQALKVEKGIIVAKAGFQSGAIKKAKNYPWLSLKTLEIASVEDTLDWLIPESFFKPIPNIDYAGITFNFNTLTNPKEAISEIELQRLVNSKGFKDSNGTHISLIEQLVKHIIERNLFNPIDVFIKLFEEYEFDSFQKYVNFEVNLQIRGLEAILNGKNLLFQKVKITIPLYFSFEEVANFSVNKYGSTGENSAQAIVITVEDEIGDLHLIKNQVDQGLRCSFIPNDREKEIEEGFIKEIKQK